MGQGGASSPSILCATPLASAPSSLPLTAHGGEWSGRKCPRTQLKTHSRSGLAPAGGSATVDVAHIVIALGNRGGDGR